MKAVAYGHANEIDLPNELIDVTLEQPKPEPRDLLVEVKAISVNPVDCKIHSNINPEDGMLKVLGWDVAGVVSAVGERVSDFKVGDKVFYAGDLTRPGGNAEFQCVDERIVGKMPDILTFSEAAALPLTAITAWELLFDRLCINKTDPVQAANGDVLLVTGAAGGVGSILVQLAKCLTSMVVVGTASRVESQEWVASMGADFVINHHEDFAAQLKAINISELSSVASLTHTDQHYESLVALLRPQSQFALIDDPIDLDIKVFKRKSISLHWEFMYTRSMFQTDDMYVQGEILNQVSSLVDRQKIKTTKTQHYGEINALNLRRAHQAIKKGDMLGKLVLEGFSA